MKNLNDIAFCEHSWKIGSILILSLIMITFFAAFYLYDEYEEYNDEYEHSGMSGWGQNHTNTAASLDQKLASATVNIVSGGDYSSGAIIHPDGYIISVLHTIKNKKSISITVHNNQLKTYKAEVIKQLPEHDIVLLKLLTTERFPYIKLSDKPLLNGDSSKALGYSEAGHFIITKGTNSGKEISITINNKQLTHLVQNSAIFSWEQNGGPQVNNAGEMVGVNLAIKDTKGSIYGLTIPVKILNAHLQDVLPKNKATIKKSNKTPPINTTNTTQSVTSANQTTRLDPDKTIAVAWWNKAREQVNRANNHLADQTFGGMQPMGTNVAFVEPQHAPTQALSFLEVGNKNPLKIGAYELNEILAIMLLGLFAGIMGAITPLLGGLFLVISMYDVMNYDFYITRPVVFISMFFIYATISIRYRLEKTADRLFAEHPIILQLPWIIIGTLAGFLMGNLVLDSIIIFLLVIVVIFYAVNLLKDQIIEETFRKFIDQSSIPGSIIHAEISDKNLEDNDPYELLTRQESKELQNKSKPAFDQWLSRALAALPVGFSSGMLAIYTGAITLQSSINGLSERKARANAAQLIMFSSLTAIIASYLHGLENELFEAETPILLAMIIIPSAFGGAFVAETLLKYVNHSIIHYASIIILVIITIIMVLV